MTALVKQTLLQFLSSDCQEWHILAAKSSDKSNNHLQEGRFANAQESCFQGAKRWNMGSAVQKWGWFADAQESRFHGTKRWNMRSAVSNEADLLMLRNRVFRLRIVQKWGVMSRQCLICWYSGIAYSVCETFKCGQCRHERTSICWFSGIAFSGFETFKYG